jgi:hypothetical protein
MFSHIESRRNYFVTFSSFVPFSFSHKHVSIQNFFALVRLATFTNVHRNKTDDTKPRLFLSSQVRSIFPYIRSGSTLLCVVKNFLFFLYAFVRGRTRF